MAVEVEILSGTGDWHGSSAELTQYSVKEDATGLDPTERMPGTGQITFAVVEDPDPEGTILLKDAVIALRDGSNGITEGIVNDISVRHKLANITADSRLIKLTNQKIVGPYHGTLEGAFRYYLEVCGITDRVVVDPEVADIPVTLRGFEDEVWVHINNLAMANNAEIALVSSNIVLRGIRGREVEFERDIDGGWGVGNSDLAQNVDVYYYNNEYREDTLAYPAGGWDEDVSVYSVEAGQTVEHSIPLDATLSSVDQPDCVAYVAREYAGPVSVYSVIGNDGLPIPPAQWIAQGGSLTISLAEGGNTMVVQIKGAAEVEYSPYRIAMGAGPSDYYSSLRVVGTGVFSEERMVRLSTAVPESRTPLEVGTEIRIPEISTIEQAIDIGMRAAGKYAGTNQEIRFTSSQTNRPGEGGAVQYPTFSIFDSEWNEGVIFSGFDAAWSGETFTDFDTYYFELVRSEFANQAFGNVIGARRLFRQAYYRITTSTVRAGGVEYTAIRDTTFEDFDTLWSFPEQMLGYGEGGYGEGGYGGVDSRTFGEFDSQWTGKSFDNMAVIPLWQR